MYDPIETDISYESLLKLMEKAADLRFAIIGGWGIFLHVKKEYTAAFGREYIKSRDIDVFIEHVDKKTFVSFYNHLIKNNYYFLNPEDENGLYEMLVDNLGIRTSKKDKIIPNIEMKFIKDDIDLFTLKNRVKVILNKKFNLFISPIEIEIPYKLYLGSEKDIEDALYLWEIFQENLNKKLINRFMNELKVSGEQYGIKI